MASDFRCQIRAGRGDKPFTRRNIWKIQKRRESECCTWGATQVWLEKLNFVEDALKLTDVRDEALCGWTKDVEPKVFAFTKNWFCHSEGRGSRERRNRTSNNVKACIKGNTEGALHIHI